MVICRDLRPNVGFYTIMRAAARLLVVGFASSLELSVIKQSLHTLHQVELGLRAVDHLEIEERHTDREETDNTSQAAHKHSLRRT